MTVNNRIAFAHAKKLCRNCLSVTHFNKDCKSTRRCFKCKLSHHTLLHKDEFKPTASLEPKYSGNNFYNRGQSDSNFNQNTSNRNGINQGRTYEARNHQSNGSSYQRDHQNQNNRASQSKQQQENNNNRNGYTTMAEPEEININIGRAGETLFPTAIIKVKSENGTVYSLRALLDQCSDEVFIKESVAKMIGGKQMSIPSFDVTGLEGVTTSKVEKSMHLKMVIDQNEMLTLEANVVKTLDHFW